MLHYWFISSPEIQIMAKNILQSGDNKLKIFTAILIVVYRKEKYMYMWSGFILKDKRFISNWYIHVLINLGGLLSRWVLVHFSNHFTCIYVYYLPKYYMYLTTWHVLFGLWVKWGRRILRKNCKISSWQIACLLNDTTFLCR